MMLKRCRRCGFVGRSRDHPSVLSALACKCSVARWFKAQLCSLARCLCGRAKLHGSAQESHLGSPTLEQQLFLKHALYTQYLHASQGLSMLFAVYLKLLLVEPCQATGRASCSNLHFQGQSRSSPLPRVCAANIVFLLLLTVVACTCHPTGTRCPAVPCWVVGQVLAQGEAQLLRNKELCSRVRALLPAGTGCGDLPLVLGACSRLPLRICRYCRCSSSPSTIEGPSTLDASG